MNTTDHNTNPIFTSTNYHKNKHTLIIKSTDSIKNIISLFTTTKTYKHTRNDPYSTRKHNTKRKGNKNKTNCKIKSNYTPNKNDKTQILYLPKYITKTKRKNYRFPPTLHSWILSVKMSLLHSFKSFDSTYGFPGEGPENTIEHINMASQNMNGAGSEATQYKYIEIIQWMRTNKIRVLNIQETHSPHDEYINNIIAGSEFIAYESINKNNHNKGGTAIIIDKEIPHTLIAIDNDSSWHNTLSEQDQNRLKLDQTTGRWVHITIKLSDTQFNLVNHYFPSVSHKARLIHVKQIEKKWTTTPNLIMTGDWNWVQSDSRDRLHKHITTTNNEDTSKLSEFINNNQLIDTYIDTYETNDANKPIFMTYHQYGSSVLSRIDRWYHHQDITHLICNITDYDDEGALTLPIPPIRSDHLPIAIMLLNPHVSKIKQYKKIWKLNLSKCHNKIIKKKIEIIIKIHHKAATRDGKWSKHWELMKKSI